MRTAPTAPTAASAFFPRGTLVRHVIALGATVLLPPALSPHRPVAATAATATSAADLDIVFALAPLLQLRTALADVDALLFADLLRAPARVASAGGIATNEGVEARRATVPQFCRPAQAPVLVLLPLRPVRGAPIERQGDQVRREPSEAARCRQRAADASLG